MAAILETQNQFYSILVRYLAEPYLYQALALDEAEAAFEFFSLSVGGWNLQPRLGKPRAENPQVPPKKGSKKKNELPLLTKQAVSIQAAVLALVHDKDGAPLARWIMELPDFPFSADPSFEVAQIIFPETLLDNELASHERLHLLIAHWAAWQIRVWTKRLKK
jgi:hypothetical protein